MTALESDIENLTDYLLLSKKLEELVCVSAKGFRGVVATAITGKFLNPTYDPLDDFYSCNPRTIFEHGIFYGFKDRIPCGKSDPLNVAKNIYALNDAWATGRRPKSAAKAAVYVLTVIEYSIGVEKKVL